jgi:hypothetical protein
MMDRVRTEKFGEWTMSVAMSKDFTSRCAHPAPMNKRAIKQSAQTVCNQPDKNKMYGVMRYPIRQALQK